MRNINQGIFLDFNYKCDSDDSFRQGYDLFRKISSEVPSILSEQRIKKRIFKFGYNAESIDSKILGRRILLFEDIYPATHSFNIKKAVDYLKELFDANEFVKSSFFSAQYGETDEVHAKKLLRNKNYLIITELLGIIPGSNDLKLGNTYSLFSIYNHYKKD